MKGQNMKVFFKSLALIAIAAAIVFTFAACGTKGVTTTSGTAAATLPDPDKNLEINIFTLGGTTALGIAGMFADVKAGKAEMNYNIEIRESADQVTGALLNYEEGKKDKENTAAIGALPTNVAATLFEKSGGKVKLLALNTLGVLYLLQNTETEDIKDYSDLAGKTVYVPGAGSNPEYIAKALFDKAGVAVNIDNSTYSSPPELQSAVASGNAKLAVLPQPLVTAIIKANSKIGIAMDFTEKWEAVYGENTLVQGCLVVNTEFAQAHPAEVKKFLEDYKKSVEFVKTVSDEAVAAAVDAKILPNAAVAKEAIPKSNLVFIAGADMKPTANVYFEKLYAINPASVGGKVPGDEFYYISGFKITPTA